MSRPPPHVPLHARLDIQAHYHMHTRQQQVYSLLVCLTNLIEILYEMTLEHARAHGWSQLTYFVSE